MCNEGSPHCSHYPHKFLTKVSSFAKQRSVPTTAPAEMLRKKRGESTRAPLLAGDRPLGDELVSMELTMSEKQTEPRCDCQPLPDPVDLSNFKGMIFGVLICALAIIPFAVAAHYWVPGMWRICLFGWLGTAWLCGVSAIIQFRSANYRQVNHQGIVAWAFYDEHGHAHQHLEAPELRESGWYVKFADAHGLISYRKVTGHLLKFCIGGKKRTVSQVFNESGLQELPISVHYDNGHSIRLTHGSSDGEVIFRRYQDLLDWLNNGLPSSQRLVENTPRVFKELKLDRINQRSELLGVKAQRDQAVIAIMRLANLMGELKRSARGKRLSAAGVATRNLAEDFLDLTPSGNYPELTTKAEEYLEQDISLYLDAPTVVGAKTQVAAQPR